MVPLWTLISAKIAPILGIRKSSKINEVHENKAPPVFAIPMLKFYNFEVNN
jgi:hypothetical protein